MKSSCTANAGVTDICNTRQVDCIGLDDIILGNM